jgi:hypothetical protein
LNESSNAPLNKSSNAPLNASFSRQADKEVVEAQAESARLYWQQQLQVAGPCARGRGCITSVAIVTVS